VDYRSC
ncbi:hypothetical protein CPC197_0681B, partial [Chlamydia psittaci C1/97]